MFVDPNNVECWGWEECAKDLPQLINWLQEDGLPTKEEFS